MSRREITEPRPNEYGDMTHPSWAMIGASRVSHSAGGSALFDSDIRHQHTVTVSISTASRRRDLNRDWLHAEREFVEVEMSEAQWASFVSSMNAGSGVPCTIRRHAAQVREAFAVYREHKTAANLRTLEAVIANMPANITFAAKSLSEHAENVVQRARADIEAMVVTKAQQLGLEPADLGLTSPQLTAGDEDTGLEGSS
jgi:hypothetical protein